MLKQPYQLLRPALVVCNGSRWSTLRKGVGFDQHYSCSTQTMATCWIFNRTTSPWSWGGASGGDPVSNNKYYLYPSRQQQQLTTAATTTSTGWVLQNQLLLLPSAAAAAARSHRMPTMQKRYGWTKAKKKRVARYKRRQAMTAAGIPIPKPPNYTPRDTPVVMPTTLLSSSSASSSSSLSPLVPGEPDQQLVQEPHQQQQQQAQVLRQRLQELQNQPALRFHMTSNAVQMSSRVRQLLELRNGNQTEIVQSQKQKSMQLFQLRPGDTGSSAVQVVALTTRIQQMQLHMTQHKKDYANKRGLQALYVRRRKVLQYLERTDFDTYRLVVKTLGLVR